MTWVAGVDGCKAGWFVVLMNTRTGKATHRTVRSFADVIGLREAPKVIAVDMPIGLPDHAVHGGRACDREARALLGGSRASSVFSPPVRGALGAADYRAAAAANRISSPDGIGLSKQTWALMPKIAEVDREMSHELQRVVKEAHPELSFRELAGGHSPAAAKKTAWGMGARAELLRAAGFGDPLALLEDAPKGVAVDDVLDAAAVCWTARRVYDGAAVKVPVSAERDSRGLLMEIWR
jgi:predicted RNase H-like nuclease